LIQGVLLTPPPYREPGRIVLLPAARVDGGKMEGARSWPSAQWVDWQSQAKSFESLAAYAWTFNFLVEQDGSESLEGMAVTRDYFRVTGLQAAMGRTFSEADMRPSAPPVVVLGYDLWQRRFHRDRNILGKTIRISRSDTPPVVIGVMPPGVRFLPSPGASQEPNYNINAHVDFWIPAVPNPARQKNPGWDVVGRLRAGVTPLQAQAELATITQREANSEHDFAGFAPRVEPLAEEMNRDGNRILLPLLGAAALVLLIACGNVAALLLVRGMQRQQEYAVRAALGVRRIALFRQASAESFLLALTGSVFGVALAAGTISVFQAIGRHAIPRLDSVSIGWPVLACALGCAVFAAMLAGLLPAWRASRMDPGTALKDMGARTTAGRAERRLLRGVTVFQTALTLALLMGAGLLIRTMVNLQKVDAGYDAAHIATMTVTAVQGDLPAFHHRALSQVSALAGVKDAAFAWGTPLTGNSWPLDVDVEGQPPPKDAKDRIELPTRSTTPGYFAMLGERVLQGRDFQTSDGRGAPQVAIVNQAFVDRYFPAGNPLGKKIWFSGRDKPGAAIIGVVSNTRTADLTKGAVPEMYLSFWQAQAFSKDLVVRTAADPRPLIPSIERALRSVDATVAVENVRTLEQIREDSVASREFAMQLLAGFSLVGCLLSVVGIYGVLSLSVASRRRELAIRAAVGAGTREIAGLVFAEGFRLIAGGIVLGIVAALALSRVLQSFLFGVEATDPATLAGVGVLFAAVALLACWAPGRRAAAVDPIEALRSE
jgi:predicted permease